MRNVSKQLKEEDKSSKDFSNITNNILLDVKTNIKDYLIRQVLIFGKNKLFNLFFSKCYIDYLDLILIIKNFNIKNLGIFDLSNKIKIIIKDNNLKHFTNSGILDILSMDIGTFKYDNSFFFIKKDIKDTYFIYFFKKDFLSFRKFIADYFIIRNKSNVDKHDEAFLYWKERDKKWIWEWYSCKKRTFDTIYITEYLKNNILRALDNFIKDSLWYNEKCITYKYNILLYGKPGTGKSTIIKGIIDYLLKFEYEVYWVNSQVTNENIDFLPSLDKKIFIFEDIDSSEVVNNRNEESYNHNLKGFLSVLDGNIKRDSSVCILTTNHLEKIDPAIYREGRIDLMIEIPDVNNEVFYKFAESFFPDEKEKAKNICLKPGLTVSLLQEKVINKMKLDQIIEEVREC